MAITELAIKIFLVFIPGIVSYLIIRELRALREHRIYEGVLYSFLLGVFNYTIYYFILGVYKLYNPKSVFHFERLINKGVEVKISFLEITLVIFIGVLTSFLYVFARNNYWLYRVTQYFCIQDDYGRLSVWERLMDAQSDEEKDWFVISDDKRNLQFEGWIRREWSTPERLELHLKDVKAYNKRGKLIDEHPNEVFISKKWEDALIQIHDENDGKN